jgi:hypothetical protein
VPTSPNCRVCDTAVGSFRVLVDEQILTCSFICALKVAGEEIPETPPPTQGKRRKRGKRSLEARARRRARNGTPGDSEPARWNQEAPHGDP